MDSIFEKFINENYYKGKGDKYIFIEGSTSLNVILFLIIFFSLKKIIKSFKVEDLLLFFLTILILQLIHSDI